jgi:hypothetical protein
MSGAGAAVRSISNDQRRSVYLRGLFGGDVAKRPPIGSLPYCRAPVSFAELSPRTFWNFAGEFSSFRRQVAATGGRR